MDFRKSIIEQQLRQKINVIHNVEQPAVDISKSVFDDFEGEDIEKSHKYVARFGVKGHYKYKYLDDVKPVKYNKYTEEVVDEDTGEVVNIPRHIPVYSKEIHAKIESDLVNATNIADKKHDELMVMKDQVSGYEDEIRILNLEIKDLREGKKQLNIEMEQAIPQGESEGVHPDEIANEYGGKLEEIDKEINMKRDKISDLNSKINVIQNDEYWKLDVEVDRLNNLVDEIQSALDNTNWEDIQKSTDAKQSKIAKVMREFSEGILKDSHGNKVTDKKQALAIAYSYFKDEDGDISKSIIVVDDIIEKGKRAEIGEIREYSGVKYRKVSTTGNPNKDWVRVKKDEGGGEKSKISKESLESELKEVQDEIDSLEEGLGDYDEGSSEYKEQMKQLDELTDKKSSIVYKIDYLKNKKGEENKEDKKSNFY